MLAERGVAEIPQALVPDVELFQVVRIIAEQRRQAVEDRQPVFLVTAEQLSLRVRKVLVAGMPEREDLAHVAALGADAPQLPRVADGDSFLVDLPADGAAVGVVARGRQHDPCRLLPARARRAGHDVPQLTVGLRVQLVEDDAARLVAVLAVRLGGEDLQNADRDPLVPAVAGLHALAVLDALAALDGPQLALGDHLCRPRRARRHKDRRVVDDRGVFLVRRADIDLRVQLAVREEVIEGQRRSQLALAVLLRDLEVEVPVPAQPLCAFIRARFGHVHRAVKFHQRLALPVVKAEELTRVGRRQALDEIAHELPRLAVENVCHATGSAPARPPAAAAAAP